jgi:hypothetical protein
MGNDQPALRALFACESGLSEPEIRLGARVRSFDMAIGNKRSTTNGKTRRLCLFAKITANCSNSFCHFHLIASVSQPQRPLIVFGVQILQYATCKDYYSGSVWTVPLDLVISRFNTGKSWVEKDNTTHIRRPSLSPTAESHQITHVCAHH